MNPPTNQVERSRLVSRLARTVLTVGLVVAVLSGLVPPTPPASAQPEPTPSPMPTAEPVTQAVATPPAGEEEPASLELTIVDEAALATSPPSPASISAAGDPYWEIETVDGGPGTGRYGSLATGDDGSLHVSYYVQGSGDLRYGLFDGSTWITTTVDGPGDVGQHTSLALDGAGNPRISYKDFGYGIGKLRYAQFTGTDWITETVHNFSDDAGSYTSLAIDLADNPHIAYLDISSFETLGYAYHDGAWNYETPDWTGQAGGHISLALADGLYPRVSYYDMLNDALLYAARDGTWNITDVNGPGEGGVHTSLTLDAANQPHISYYAQSSNELMYAHFDGGDWITETVAALGEWEVHTSLALDAGGTPHIAYFDDLNYSLGYATLDGTDWITQTVDSSGGVGGYPSLALDADGYAHIAYYHYTDGLKHAWMEPCVPAEILDVNGPRDMILGSWSIFTATVSPSLASVPLEFTWQPPGQDPVTYESYTTETTIEMPASITGTHPLTVTVSGCGGVLETVRQVTIEEAPLLDLVVTDLWQDGGAIWYQIANTGPITAPADHVSLLTIDGIREAEDGIKVALAPGETMNRSFPYAYACSDNEDTIRIDVDAARWFDEEDETNNYREESWFCDQEPPAIADVTFEAGETEATIVWATDDPGDSLVEYSPLAGRYDASESDPEYRLDHKIGLTGLSPSTTYHFRVLSTDPNGLQSISRDYYFETQPVAAPAPPDPSTVVAALVGNADVYTVKAKYADTSNIERVEFYLDGKLIDTDYAEGETEGEYEGIIAPHALGYTREEFYSPQHQLETMARAFDGGFHISEEILAFGHESPPTEVEITFPPPELTIHIDGDTVPADKRVDFTIFAAEYDFQCDWIPVEGSKIMEPDCADVQQPVEMVQFLVDNKVVHTSYPTNDNDLWHHFSLELGGFTGAQKTVVARAIDTAGGKHDAQATIYIHRIVREPILDVTREITRIGTHFRVRLTVENKPEATGDAKVDRVNDNVAGFQIVPKETAEYRVTSSYAYWIGTFARDNNIEIDLGVLPADTITLSPGDSIVLEYLMVPILYEEPFDFRIGGLGRDVDVYYEEPSGDLEWRGFDRRIVFTLQSMVADAIGDADYLLVTHPSNLGGTYGANGMNPLLGTMAELATLKQGVLGYLETPDPRYLLDALVEPGGGWAARLHPNFSTEGGGYMLIVGETEIVPAWHIEGFDGDRQVRLSDQFYSAIGNGTPLINLGRVIGDSYAQLQDTIQRSINVYLGVPGYGFDRSHALVASGVGNMRSIMITEVDYAQNTLQNQGLSVTKMHWKDYADLGGYDHSFDQYDGLAAGDVDANGTDELVVSEDLHNRIRVLDGNGAVVHWFVRDIEDGDALAVGDFDGNGFDEIVLADSSSDTIHFYSPTGFELFWFPRSFGPDERLAVGNVVGGVEDEIVIADPDDHIYVLELSGLVLKDFAFGFGEQDGLAVGDVNGDNMDEVVLRTETARSSTYYTATVASYVAAGAQLSQTASFEITKVRDGDALATGDINGDGTDDILLGRLHYYVSILNQQGSSVRGGIPTELEPYDGLVAGRFSGGAGDEILIADQDGRFYYPDIQFIDQGHNAYRAVVPDHDVLFFLGHGSPDSWGPGLLNYTLPFYLTSGPHFPLPLGNTNPVVYGATCLSGNYQSGDDDNIAEAFLDSGAAVFIGAVENSSAGPTERSLEWFLDNWEDDEAVGKAWFDMERAKWQERDHVGDGWDFLLHEYNLYGDPKFGGPPAAPDVRSVMQRAAQVPPEEFSVEVPDLLIETSADGYDQVTIPGGQLIVEAGAYQIPYWTHTIEITKGYRIEDVALSKRSEPLMDTDLNLPVTPDEIWRQDSSEGLPYDTAGPVLDPDDSWVPSLHQEFTWQVVDNADGTTTLIVKVYPFYYQPLTGNARFHPRYAFDVTSISTPVVVEQLRTSQVAYQEGDTVPVDLVVENTGRPQEVIVDATIWRNTGDELVDGLLLRTLHELSGTASFALEWDSGAAPSGYYHVEVKLYDSDSNLLDQDSLTFRLGILSGEITSLQATPEFFVVGETIDISMVFENVGTLPITGTAVIEVQTAGGLAASGPYTHTIEGLAPGVPVELQEAWDTAGVALGDYRVIGYVLYDARSTGASTVALTNLRKVYLPVVLRGY